MKGRLQRIVVVVLAALLALVLAVAGQAPASVSVGQVGRIDHVADGDTVDLTNGAKIRLVQIDTPEVYFHARVLRKAGVGDDEATAPARHPRSAHPRAGD